MMDGGATRRPWGIRTGGEHEKGPERRVQALSDLMRGRK